MKPPEAPAGGVVDEAPAGIPEDWAERSQGHLDLVLVLAGVTLLVLGVVMTFQEYGHELESGARAASAVTTATPEDAAYRAAYVPWLLGLAVVTGALALWRVIRVRRSARLARHAKRPLTMLLTGCAVLDVAFYADFTFGLTAPHATRALVVTPAYALAGFLIAGAAWRIRSLIRPLPPGDPETV